MDRRAKAHQMEPLLQDKYVTSREGRWVLPIKSGVQHRFDGIIHASSQSQKTVFMEPSEIVPMNNRLKQIESEIEEEVQRILSELSSYLHGLLIPFQRSQATLLHCDITFAKARLLLQIKGNPCQFSEDQCHLMGLRHPLLELNGDKVVPNTLQLDHKNRILLLSGPNAGGKTVLLKSFGLAAQMARHGLPVAASAGSKIPFFKEIFISVGDAQNVGAHLSTFAAHLKLLDQATQAKGTDQLVLVDEICSSTDPEEGAALARSFIHKFAEQKCFAIVTSHFGHLKKGWSPHSGVINGSLDFRANQGPTYQFSMGVPGQSLAIQTAQRVGIDPSIIHRAMDFMGPEFKKYQKDTQSIETLKEELHHVKRKLDEKRTQVQKMLQKYEKLVEKFKNERNDMLKQAQIRAERKIDKLIQRAQQKAQVENIFQKYSELQKVKADIPKIIKTRRNENDTQKFHSLEEFLCAISPGSKVYVPSIQREAIVQGKPNSKGEVSILSNSMRLMVPWQSLQPSLSTSSTNSFHDHERPPYGRPKKD